MFLLIGILGSCGGGKNQSETAQEAQIVPAEPSRPLTMDEIWERRWGNKTLKQIFDNSRRTVIPLESLPSRKPFRKSRPLPSNPHDYFTQMTACVKNYQTSWKNSPGFTRDIVNQLSQRTDHACWSEDMKKEVSELADKITAELNHIQGEISSRSGLFHTLSQKTMEKENQVIRDLLQNLGEHYQELQEDISYCRLKDITQNFPLITPIPASSAPQPTARDKHLLNILGDVFATSSGIDQQSTEEVAQLLEQRKQVIDLMLNKLKDHSYIATEFQSEPCQKVEWGYHPGDFDHATVPIDFKKEYLLDLSQHIESALSLTKTFNGSGFPNFIKEFNKQVDQLKKEKEWFYFQGRSTDHTVIYSVIKEAGNQFAFRVYNSGDGLSFHFSILEGSDEKVFPFVERKGVSQQRLTQISFLKALYDLAHQKETRPSGIESIYENVIYELGGKTTTQSAQFLNLLDPQVSKNSNYYVVPYMEASRQDDPKLAYHLEFIVKSKLLDIYFHFNENRINDIDEVRKLADKSLTFYAEELARNISILPSKKGRYLDWGIARESAERIKKYRDILDQSSQKQRLERESHIVRFGANDLKHPNTHIPFSQLTHLEQIKSTIQTFKTVLPLDIENWKPIPEQLTKDIQRFLTQLKPQSSSSYEEKQLEAQKLIAGIPEITKQIPLEEAWIKNLNDSDLRLFLGQLNDLSQFQFWALAELRLSSPTEHSGLSPGSILTQIRLLSLADLAIRIYQTRDAGQDFIQFPSLYSSQMKRLLEGEGRQKWISVLSIQNYSWSSLFQELSKYWKDQGKISANSFAFQWDRYPLYAEYNLSSAFERHIYKKESEMGDSHWSQPYGRPSFERWNDLQWASRVLAKHHLNTIEIIGSLEYNDKSRLPKEFFEIRDISFLTHYILAATFSQTMLKTSGVHTFFESGRSNIYSYHDARISKPVSFEYKEEPKPPTHPHEKFTPQKYHANDVRFFGGFRRSLDKEITTNYSFYHIIPIYPNQSLFTGDPNYSLELSTERSHLGPWNEIIQAKKSYLSLENESLSIPFPYYRQYSSAELLSAPQMKYRVPLREDLSKTREVPITNLELQRQLLNLGSPLTTLAYFRENPNYLLEKRWQILFKALMFQPELLNEEFKKTHTLPVLLSDFCWLNFENQMNVQDYQTASFFLRMHQILQEFVENAGFHQSWPKNRIAREGFKRILAHLKGISDLKFQVYRDVIRTYKYADFKNETWLDLALFIEAAIYRDRNGLEEYESNFDVEEENDIFGVYQHKRKNLDSSITFLPSTQKNQLFNDVIQTFRSHESNFTWTKQTEEKWQGIRGSQEILLDLSRPLILMNKQEEIPLPGKIKELPLFKKIIRWNENEPYVNWLGGEKYEFIDLEGHPIRIDATARGREINHSLLIQKKWGLVWYELLSDSAVNQMAVNTTNGEENWNVVPGYRNWMSITDMTQKTGEPAAEAYLQEPGIPWDQWDQIRPRSNHSETLVFNKEDGKLFAVIRKPYQQSPIIQKVKYDNNQALIYGTQLGRIKPLRQSSTEKPEPFEFLSRVEHPRFIWLWKDRNHHIEQIELPRFDVSFYPKDNRLISPELESFSLSGNQFLPESIEKWGNYSHFLILEKNGKSQVLIPRIKPIPNNRSLFTEHKLDWFSRSAIEKKRNSETIDLYGRKSQKFLVWSIDEFDHQLKLSHFEDKFFLSLIHLWESSSEYPSYDRARELLYGSLSELGDLRTDPSDSVISGAREILEWIYALLENDYDPRAIALRLGTATIIIQNDLSNQRLAISSVKNVLISEFLKHNYADILTRYHKYLDVRERISIRWFPEDLERILLTSLRTNNDEIRLNGRFLELKGQEGDPIIHKNEATFRNREQPKVFSVNDFQYLTSNDNPCPKQANLYQGIIPSKSELYSVAIRLDQPSLVKEDLINLLSTVFKLSPDTLKSKTSEQLKSEFLSYLRLLMRQNNSNLSDCCQEMIQFIYAVASSDGNRSEIRNLTMVGNTVNLNKIRERLDYYSDRFYQNPSFFEKYYANKQFIEQQVNAMRVNQVDWSFLNGNPSQSAVWKDRNQARQARYWDPRTESIPKEGLGYKYDRNLNLEDAKYDLHQEAVLPSLKFASYLKERDLNDAEKIDIRQVSEKLKAIFEAKSLDAQLDESHENYDPFIQKKLNDYRHLIEVKEKTDLGENSTQHSLIQKPSKKIYEWTKSKNLENLNQLNLSLRPDLQKLSEDLLKTIKRLKKEIEGDLRTLPKGTWSKLREEIFREASVEIQPDLKHVLHIYASKKFSNIFVLNAGLKPDQARLIFEKLTSYLIRSTYYFQLQETIRRLDELKPNAGQEQLRTFYQTATALRHYDIALNPDYLVFEYMMRMLIRKDQIDNLSLLTQEKSTLLEMIMGAGKTSVLLPLASHRNAVSGKQLSLVVLPEALLPSMIKQLSAQLEKVFNQGVDQISIQRKHKYDANKLQYLYSRLRYDLDHERVVVISNSSIQSLFLIFIESLYDYKYIKDPNLEREKMAEVAAMQNIFQLFRGYGYVLIDEVDSILDIMASHRFSIGHRTQLEPSIVDATIGLYRILAEDDEIHKKVKIPFQQESMTGSHPYNREYYEEHVKPRLIESVAKKESAEYFFDQPEFIQQFKSLDMNQLKAYFGAKTLHHTQSFIEKLPSHQLRDVITVLYTQIHQILPMTLDKMYLVHYGLCPEANQRSPKSKDIPSPLTCHPFIGIPYHSGLPVTHSRFGTDLESLNYTIQSHIEHRDVLEMFKLEMDRLQKLFKQQKAKVVRDKINSYFNRELSDGEILNLSDAEITIQSKAVSTRIDLVLGLVKRYAAPKIEIFPNQLSTNSHIYPLIFKKLQGMTGTLWNYESFPEFYNHKEDSDSLARTLNALWKNPPSREVLVIDPPAPRQEIPQTLQLMLANQGALSIIDQGGFFKGKKNQKVVESMLSLPRPADQTYAALGIPQLIFYDSQHQIQLMSYENTHPNIRPYVAQDIDRNLTGAFWDMQHTTGSDLKVHPNTVGLLTLNKFSIMRDLLQSAWRLRELEQSQSALLMVDRDDLRIISKFLVQHFGNEYAISDQVQRVPLEKILLYLAAHEAVKAGELNYRSVKGSQRAIIVDAVFDKLVDKSAFGDDLIFAFDHIKSFFGSPRGDHPFERYGIPVVKTSAIEFLKNEVQRIFYPIREAFKNSVKIQEAMDQVVSIKKDSFRKNVITALKQAVEDQEELEIETEQELEQEQEQEVEKEVQSVNLDPQYKKAPINWDKNKFFSGELLREPTDVRDIPHHPLSHQEIKKLSPVMRLQGIFEKGELSSFSNLFDRQIMGSLNLFPVFQTNYIAHDHRFKPFGVYQGFIDFVLVGLDQNLKLESATMITRDEALEILGPWLIDDQTAKNSQPDKIFLIYQFGNGFIRYSESLIQNLKIHENLTDAFYLIEHNPNFQHILMQIKFLSGRVTYTDSEKTILKKWIQDTGKPDLFYELFTHKILEFKAKTREDFEDSDFHQVFKSIQTKSND